MNSHTRKLTDKAGMHTHRPSTTLFTRIVACATLMCFVYAFILHEAAIAMTTMAEDYAAARSLKSVPGRVVIPSHYGRVTGMHEGDSRRLIVYVQDLHCNPEVQRNIAGILNIFEQKYGIRRIYVEGAPSGRLDTSLLASIPDDTIRGKTIEGLVNKGLLSGSEYYALKYRQDKLFGLEDWGIYRDNLARYRTLAGHKAEHASVMAQLRSDITARNHTHLDRKLKRIQKVLVGARKESRYLRMEKLGERVGHPISGYPNLARYLSAIKLSRAIRYNRVSDELRRYLKDLQARMPFDEYSALTQSMNNPEAQDAFYLRLAAVAKNPDTSLRRFPNVARFLAWHELNYHINPVLLIAEETLFTRRVVDQFAVRKLDHDMLLLSRMGEDAADYVALTMTPDQYRRFSADKEQFMLLARKYCDPSVVRAALSVLSDQSYQEFYAANVRRNGVFLRSLSRQEDGAAPTGHGAQKDILPAVGAMLAHLDRFKTIDFVIAGGFHMDLAKLLKENNVSYLMITPGMTKSHHAGVYEQIMSGKIDYKRFASSALAPMADSLGIEPDIIVAMIAEMLQSSLRSDFSPAQCAEILVQWQSSQEKLKDIAISYTESERTFVVSVRAGGVEHPVIDLIAPADGSVTVVSRDKDAPIVAHVNDSEKARAIAERVRENMTELFGRTQMLGLNRAEILDVVARALVRIPVVGSITKEHITAFANVLVSLLFEDAAQQQHSRYEPASSRVRELLDQLGASDSELGEFLDGKSLVLNKVSGSFFPAHSSGNEMAFASIVVKDNTILLTVRDDFWERVLRAPSDMLMLLLKHELREYLFLAAHPGKTYRDFHDETMDEFAPLFDGIKRQFITDAFQHAQENVHAGAASIILDRVSAYLGQPSAPLSPAVIELLDAIRAPPFNLSTQEQSVFNMIVNSYTLGILHGGETSHLISSLDRVSIPVRKRSARRLLSYLPDGFPQTSLDVPLKLPILGGGYCAYAFRWGKHTVKYLKSPAYRMLPDHDYSVDYGVFEGRLDRTIWEYIRSIEKFPDFIVPTRIYIAQDAVNMIDKEEQRQLKRFIKAGIVVVMPHVLNLQSDDFNGASGGRSFAGPTDGNVAVSVAIVQPAVVPVIDKIRDSLREGQNEVAREVAEKYIKFIKSAWQHGMFLVDASMKNIGIDADGNIKAFDVEYGGIDPALKKPVRSDMIKAIHDENWEQLSSADDEFKSFYNNLCMIDDQTTDMFTTEGLSMLWQHHLPLPTGKQMRVLFKDPLVKKILRALRAEISGVPAGKDSLAVQSTHGLPDNILRARIITSKGEPVIFAVNPTEVTDRDSGKAWGKLILPLEQWGIQNSDHIVYHFRDLITGETYDRSGASLYESGLEIGLSPKRVHVLKIDRISVTPWSPLAPVLARSFPDSYARLFQTGHSTVQQIVGFFRQPVPQLLIQAFHGRYSGQSNDRILKVNNPVITGGLKTLDNKPVIVAINRSDPMKSEGVQSFGTIAIPFDWLGIIDDETVHYYFHDLLTGEKFKKSGRELYENQGLVVGLEPGQAHVFSVEKDYSVIFQGIISVLEKLFNLGAHRHADLSGDSKVEPRQEGYLSTIGIEEWLPPESLDFSSAVSDELQAYEKHLLEFAGELSRQFMAATHPGTSLPPVLLDGVAPIQNAIRSFSSRFHAQEMGHLDPAGLSESFEFIRLTHESFIIRYNAFATRYNAFLAAGEESGHMLVHYASDINMLPLLPLGDLSYFEINKIQFEAQTAAALVYFEQVFPGHMRDRLLGVKEKSESVMEWFTQCIIFHRENALHRSDAVSRAVTEEENTLLLNLMRANDDFMKVYDNVVDDYNEWARQGRGAAPLTVNRGLSGLLDRFPGGKALATAAMVVEELLFAPVRELATFVTMLQLYLTNKDAYPAAAQAFVARHRYQGAAYTPDQTEQAIAGLTIIIKDAASARNPIRALTRLWAGHLAYNYRNGTLGGIRNHSFSPSPLSMRPVPPDIPGRGRLADVVVSDSSGYFQQTTWLLPWFPGMISLRLRDDVSPDTRDSISGEVVFTDKNGGFETFPMVVGEGKLEVPFVLSGERYEAGKTYPFSIHIRVKGSEFSISGAQKVEMPKDEQWTYVPTAREIVPGKIYLGNALAVATKGFLSGRGVRAVLNVAEERDTRYHAVSGDMAYAQYEFSDFTQNPLDRNKLWFALMWMHGQISAGKPVFVHCHAGIGRSSSVVIAYLALVLYPEKSYDEIVAMVRREKPDIYPHLGLADAIDNLRRNHNTGLAIMSGRKNYPVAAEKTNITDVAFLGVRAGQHIRALAGKSIVIRANITFTGTAPRGVRLRTNINRPGADYDEILMRRVEDSGVQKGTVAYEVTVTPRHEGRFWATVSVTPNEHDHYLTGRTWVGGKHHDIYVDVAAERQAGLPPDVLNGLARQLLTEDFLVPNILPSLPHRVFSAIVRFAAGVLNEDRTWFEQRVRQEPAVFAQRSVMVYVPRWDGVNPELNYLLDNRMNPIVLTSRNIDEESAGKVIGRVMAGSRTLVVRMQENALVASAGYERRACPVVLTMAPDGSDREQDLTPEELRSAISDLVSDVLDGVLSDVVDHPWLVLGTDLEPSDIGGLPVVLARADASQGEQRKYFEKFMAWYADTVATLSGSMEPVRSVNGVTRGQAAVMVQTDVTKEIINPAVVHTKDKLVATEGFARSLRQRGISKIGLDGILAVTKEGKVRFAGMPLDQFDALYTALGGAAGETEIVLPLAVPAGVASSAFARNLAALLASHPGVGVRVRFENSDDTAKTIESLGVALFRAKVPAETFVLIDCNDSSQPALVDGVAARYGLRMIPLGDREQAVEITVRTDMNVTSEQFTAALQATQASLVVVTVPAVPMMGETESLNFGDILSVLSMYLAGRRTNSPDAARLKGVRNARSAIASMGKISVEDAGVIANKLVEVTAHAQHGSIPLSNFADTLSGKIPDPVYKTLFETVDYITSFNPAVQADADVDLMRASMLDGFVTELLGEMLVRRIPGYDQLDRDAMENNGQLEILKKGLVILATAGQQDDLTVNLTAMLLGILPDKGTVDVKITREQLSAHASTVVRHFALRALLALSKLPENDPRRQAVMADISAAADEITRSSGPEADEGDALSAARALAESVVAAPNNSVSATDFISGTRNQVAMILNREKVPPESCALLMLITLDLLNADSRKGWAETATHNTQPALKAITLMLSAA